MTFIVSGTRSDASASICACLSGKGTDVTQSMFVCKCLIFHNKLVWARERERECLCTRAKCHVGCVGVGLRTSLSPGNHSLHLSRASLICQHGASPAQVIAAEVSTARVFLQVFFFFILHRIQCGSQTKEDPHGSCQQQNLFKEKD